MPCPTSTVESAHIGAHPTKLRTLLLAVVVVSAAMWWPSGGRAAEAKDCRGASHGSVREVISGASTWSAAPAYEGANIADPTGLAVLPRPAIIVDVSMPGADFSHIDLSTLCFAGGDLSNSRWSHADGIALIGVNVSGANWRTAALNAALLIDSDLDAVDATGAQLDDVSIAGGSLAMNLAGASMRRAFIRCGRLRFDGNECGGEGFADLAKTDLTSAIFEAALPPGWKLQKAYLNGISIDLDNIDSLAGATLRGSTIVTSSGFRTESRASLSPEEVALAIAGMSWSDEDQPLRGRPPSVLRPGARLLYVDSDPSSPAFRKTPLWRRLLPVISASARASLVVKVVDSSQIETSASSVDGRGKMCDIGPYQVEVLKRGRGGWFDRTIRTSDPDDDDNRGQLIRFAGDQVEFHRYDSDCASNTTWGTMRYLTSDPALINTASR